PIEPRKSSCIEVETWHGTKRSRFMLELSQPNHPSPFQRDDGVFSFSLREFSSWPFMRGSQKTGFFE
ncbi:MAG: hypothetical protein K8H75_00950, partial [Sulfuricella sp.]|nr:hypothetical protein [Sulfuricella sp.]